MARIDAFLKLGVAQGCSDLHLAVGVPPMLRMYGDLVPIKFRDLGDAELEGYITEVLNPSQIKVLRDGHDLDFSYVSAEGGRFLRIEVKRRRGRTSRRKRALQEGQVWSMKGERWRPSGTRIAAVDNARPAKRDVSRHGRHLVGGHRKVNVIPPKVNGAPVIDQEYLGTGRADVEP